MFSSLTEIMRGAAIGKAIVEGRDPFEAARSVDRPREFVGNELSNRPVCPDCGEAMTKTSPRPAEPDNNIQAWPGGWESECGYALDVHNRVWRTPRRRSRAGGAA